MQIDVATAKALLEWQLELGATEPIMDSPIDRFALVERKREAQPNTPETPSRPDIAIRDPGTPKQDANAQPAAGAATDQDSAQAVALARDLAGASASLDDLRAAIAGFDRCDLKRGARNTVFADGNPNAPLMIVGEAPGRDEDREGRPFVGRAGQLLDAMFAPIGRARGADDPDAAVYITNVLPWRPPQNRDPEPGEIAMLLPFLKRHIELVKPACLVLMGNTACQALLGQRGITRLRGNWHDVGGIPAMPTFHPAYLLRNPQAKREAWADLLAIKARLAAG